MAAIRYATWGEMAALDRHEAQLRRNDRRNGTNTYGAFRAQQGRAFRAGLAADRAARR